jgi:hypothetical protein
MRTAYVYLTCWLGEAALFCRLYRLYGWAMDQSATHDIDCRIWKKPQDTDQP